MIIKNALPSGKIIFVTAATLVLFSFSTSVSFAQGVFGGGSSSGGGVFGQVRNFFSDSIESIFDNLGVGVPGGAVIPGITPVPGGSGELPESELPPAFDSSKRVKLTLEWDAQSVGGEAVKPKSSDPLEDEHKDFIRRYGCPPCPVHLEESPLHEGEQWHFCAIQQGCVAGAPTFAGDITHSLYGWCGHQPTVLTQGVPSDLQLAYEGPNTYTLPSAVSNKYVRRDGYVYGCVRQCGGGLCKVDNYMEFQTMIYHSNAISLYLRAENLSEQLVENVVIRVSELSYGDSSGPLPHNLDYPIGDNDYVHAGELDSNDLNTVLNGIPVRVVGDELLVGPLTLLPKGIQEIPLQSASYEKDDIPSAQTYVPREDSNNTLSVVEPLNGMVAGLNRLIEKGQSYLLGMNLSFGNQIVKTAQAQCGGIDWGVNIDPANPGGIPSAAGLGGSGLLRIEFKDCTAGTLSQEAIDMYRNLLNNYQNGGKGINMILDYASLANAHDVIDANPEVREAAIDAFVQRAVDVCESMGDLIDSYEIWNEPDLGNIDGHGKPILPPEVFGEIVRRTSDALEACDPGAKKISGGLASGNWSYLQGMGPLPSSLDSVGVHPYAKTVGGVDWGGVGDMVDFLNQGYGLTGGRPFSITEMGVNSPDGNQVALFMERFANDINGDLCGKVDSVTWFSWSDAMVPNFGLVDAAGNPKPQFYSYFENFLGIQPPSQIDYFNPIVPQGNNCGGGGNPMPSVPVGPPGTQPPPVNPDAPWNPTLPGGVVPYGHPIDPPDLVNKQGEGAIVPRDYNFVCDPDDDLDGDEDRCDGAGIEDGYIIDKGSEEFDKYRDVTGIGGCGYWASSNNSVVGPLQIVAEYGGSGTEATSRSVLLAAIPIGGRILDDQARPYGWPASGAIEQNWGFTGQANSQGYYRSNSSQNYGEFRCCGNCSPPTL